MKASTTNGSASGTKAFTFTPTTEINKLITVTDQVTGSATVKTLGTADWFTGIVTLGAGVTKVDTWTFGYTTTYTRPKNGCAPFTNTAKITQTGQTSSVTVSVCGPPWIGDGTIGFWSNKNGQAPVSYTHLDVYKRQTYDNTATIVETGQTDDAFVKVCVGANVTVSKDGSGSYTRTYLWKIAKSATKTQVNVAPNGDAIFDYTVTATPNGSVDSAWTMAGTITVTNPNDFQSITVNVTDVPSVGGGAVCTVANGTGVVLAPKGQIGDSVTLNYSCTAATSPSYTGGTNKATATVTAGVTPTASVTSAPAPITFTEGVSVDKTVNVYDDKTVSGGQNLLGQATWNAAGTPTPFTYSVTQKPTTVGSCTEYTNTAWIDLQLATDPTATAKVKACVGADLTVTKTAATTMTRTYKWSIVKSAPNGATYGLSLIHI